MEQARALDEVAANATVAPVARLVDGWLAKRAPGLPFRRANAVLPPVGAAADPDRAAAVVDDLLAWYAGHGRRLIVQVSAADPTAPTLDALLARRGFTVEAPVDVMVATPFVGGAARGVEVTVSEGVDAAWAEGYGAVHADDSDARDRVEAYGRMLADLGPDALGAVARCDGTLAGVGFAVRERGWRGVFGMGTAPEHRRRGVARSVLAALADGSDAYLQVEVDNEAAQALYRGAGFARSHGYHYRVSAPPA